MGQQNRAAVREPKFIAPERRNPPRIDDRRVVEVIPRIERRVAQKLKHRSVKSAFPDRVTMSVNPAAPRPISAGIHPELDWISSTASTLKFVNVAPPISGSLMSAPSMANIASTPRCPSMANCCVKFVAPFVSVIVPAASSSSVLKSRPFSGSELTDWLESFSPPVAPALFAAVPGALWAVLCPLLFVPAALPVAGSTPTVAAPPGKPLCPPPATAESDPTVAAPS